MHCISNPFNKVKDPGKAVANQETLGSKGVFVSLTKTNLTSFLFSNTLDWNMYFSLSFTKKNLNRRVQKWNILRIPYFDSLYIFAILWKTLRAMAVQSKFQS